MKFFVRAVITGFALSLGAALFKKIAKRVGLDDEDAPGPLVADGATDPGLHQHPKLRVLD